ncbi:transmembrane protein 205-like [Oscarella lobularis]|uniref:transmembrane protein 205-like n=1 Tax=Oscarella lobularis TaxID=121494 RepID=UPI00331431E3
MEFYLNCGHIVFHSFWFGAQTWLLGFQGFLLRSTVTRQEFGFIQSRIFRAFFRVGTIASTASLACFALAHHPVEVTSEKIQLACLSVSLATTALNFAWVNPTVTNYMVERLSIEKSAGVVDRVLTADLEPLKDDKKYQEVSKRFRRYHGVSVLLLLSSVACMFVHGCIIATKI